MDDQVYHHLDDLIDVIDMELWFDGLIEDKRNLSND
jgi:CRISPR/Cas system CSM-associated protein Csm5 (group 7 of RAMP superfamily)